MSNLPQNTIDKLYKKVSQIITEARNTVYRTANFEMVKAYWNIGGKIVEEEQNGESRAEYGKGLIKGLSTRLIDEYGQGFDKTNLWNMRKFYALFPKVDALRQELSWTHYRMLLRVNNDQARIYYLEECVSQKWSTRTLQRQVNTQYYERILSSNPASVPSIPVSKDELDIVSLNNS